MKKFLPYCSLLLLTGSLQAQNALHFDGVDDHVSVPNASDLIDGSTAISMTLWVYPENTASGFPDFDGVAGFRNDVDADFYILQLASNNVEARFRDKFGTVYTITYNNGMNLNAWNHYALVLDGSNLTLYHDGAYASSIAATGNIINTTTAFDMGRTYWTDAASSFYLQGKLDDVTLWDKALSASEVSDIYSSCGYDHNDPNLKLCFQFNQGTAGGTNTTVTTLNDSQGNINGTVTNFTLSGSTSNFVSGINGNTQSTITASACEEYTAPSGAVYTAGGTYQDTIPNAAGCDSIMEIQLTIENPDTSVTLAGSTLTANASGLTYEWIDCATGLQVPGASGQSFTPALAGAYAVVITSGSCTDTSGCHTVSAPTGLEDEELNLLSTYPNPVKNDLIVSFGRRLEEVRIEILSLSGQTLLREEVASVDTHTLDMSHLPSGIYLLHISASGSSKTIRVARGN